MKRSFFVKILLMSMIAVSCTKAGTINHSLSLDKVFLTASVDGGVLELNVTSNGQWSARIEPEVSWAKIEKGSTGSGNGKVKVNFDANYGEFRAAGLVVSLSADEKIRRIPIYQESSSGTPVISIGLPETLYEYNAAEYSLPYYSNIERSSLKLTCSAEWVHDLSLDQDEISFRLDENEDEQNRRFTQIILSYDDGFGNVYKSEAAIIQAPKIDRSKFDSTIGNDSYEHDDEFGF